MSTDPCACGSNPGSTLTDPATGDPIAPSGAPLSYPSAPDYGWGPYGPNQVSDRADALEAAMAKAFRRGKGISGADAAHGNVNTKPQPTTPP